MGQNLTKENRTSLSRRNFLKFLLVGTGAFFVWKILGSQLFKKEEPKPKTQVGDFSVSESGDEIIFSDSSGEDILIIDKKTF